MSHGKIVPVQNVISWGLADEKPHIMMSCGFAGCFVIRTNIFTRKVVQRWNF